MDSTIIDEATKLYFEHEFRKLDDGDGYLTSDELADCLSLLGFNLNDEEIDEVRIMFDRKGDGRLRIDDVIDNLAEIVKHSMNGTQILKAFRVFDSDGDGVIRLPEMQKVLCQGDTGMTGSQAAKILSVFMKFDKNKDGRFDYSEFINIWSSEDYNLVRDKVNEFIDLKTTLPPKLKLGASDTPRTKSARKKRSSDPKQQSGMKSPDPRCQQKPLLKKSTSTSNAFSTKKQSNGISRRHTAESMGNGAASKSNGMGNDKSRSVSDSAVKSSVTGIKR